MMTVHMTLSETLVRTLQRAPQTLQRAPHKRDFKGLSNILFNDLLGHPKDYLRGYSKDTWNPFSETPPRR